MQAIQSILVWLSTIIGVFVVFFPILASVTIFRPFNPKQTWGHWIGTYWALTIAKINPGWKVTIHGKENLPKGAAVVIVNHESLADIMALYLLKCNFKWLAKESLFKIPIFGWAMAMCGYIPLKRGSIKGAATSMEKAHDWLRKGIPILIFPEGTRSKDGNLGEFKGGAFKLAIEENVPLVPVVLTGTRHIIEKGTWILKDKIHVQMEVLPQIQIANLPSRDEKEVRTLVREKMRDVLWEIKKRNLL